MVMIHTSDDILRVLRERPEWKADVRREILSEELMNLPGRFDQFAGKTEQFMTDSQEFIAEQRQINDEQRQFNADTQEFIDEQRQFNEKVDGFIDRTNARFGRIERDISNMRGEYARNNALREATDIAEDMGFQMVRVWTEADLRELIRTADTTGIVVADLRSFRRADLIIEAMDAGGSTNYIAVEISNEADERDTRRALRNAAFLTRFTGQPARAAIASIRNDRRIQHVIDSGEIYWHELADRDTVPE